MTAAKSGIASLSFGVVIGVILSVLLGLVYLVLLHEPGPAFYPFAALILIATPIISGIVAAFSMQENQLWAFSISTATTLVVAFLLFLLTYVVLPQFARTNVQLPASCDGFNGSYDPPADLVYSLPDLGDGILITSDAHSAVVAVIDSNHTPFPSTAFLVNKSDNSIILTMHFDNDIISAAITEGTLTIYNDKLGFVIDARTGNLEKHFLLIDNYGGLTTTDRPFISRASDGHWYMETTAVISSWNVDGTVVSRRHLTFNGIARGCFISGDTHAVIQLSP